jgi:hypothetical protein
LANPKQTARLDGWVTLKLGDTQRFAGIVSGHPTLPDGQEIFTSEVNRIFQEDNVTKVETRNTIYTLGQYSETLFKKLHDVGMPVMEDWN